MSKKVLIATLILVLYNGCTYMAYHRDYGTGPGPTGRIPVYGPLYYNPVPRPLTQDDAVAMVNSYLASLKDPNLKSGKPVIQGDSYQIPVRTLEGSIVDIFIVDKFSGWVRSMYRGTPAFP